MKESYDLIIVGAGIVGAACALECARSGMKVLVMERGRVGSGATAGSMGHIAVMDDSEAHLALTNWSRRLWHNLAADLGEAAECERCGTLWLALDEEELALARRKQELYEKRGIAAELLDGAAIAQLEPNLAPGFAGGLLVSDDLVIDPLYVTKKLLERAQDRGVVVRTGVEVTGLLSQGGITLSDSSRIPAGRSLSATGAWAPQLSAGLPVRKRKGHLVEIKEAPGFVQHQVVELGYLKSAFSMKEDSVAFSIQPRRGGRLLIGSSRQYDLPDSTIDQAIVNGMLERAFQFMPGLAQLERARVWSGQRATTPDKLPLIGPSAGSEKIWLATGHEGLGVTTSLGTGRLVADLLLGRPTEIPSAPFAPSRFSKGVRW